MRVKNYTQAITQAQANANRTQTPRWIFIDTSGNWRVEASEKPLMNNARRIDPETGGIDVGFTSRQSD